MTRGGWKWIGNSCYYFYYDGHMASDETIDGSYVNKSGAWSTDHWSSNSVGWWYNLKEGGYAYGWKYINGYWYYFTDDAYMATGWELIEDKWYYLGSSGAMTRGGWKWINNKCYYFYYDGHMASDETIDGSYVDKSGAWVD